MNVLMTADTVGGVWTYALDLARALRSHGVLVHLATMGRPPDAGQRAAAADAGVAWLYESRYALEWEDDPWEEVDRAGAWLLALADEVEADVVHLNGYVHASLRWTAPVVVVAHSDVLSWWRAVKQTPVPAWLDGYRDRVEGGLRRADAVCAPTQAVLDDLAASYRFETPRLVIANGRSTQTHTSAAKEALIAGLGRFWDEAKNLAALQRIGDRLPWPLLLVGPGTPAGRVSPAEAATALARASIFASPARYEPFGLTALEAAQAGCALVLSDIPSLREVWEDAAAYVPPDDDEAILAALCRLCDDHEKRQTLAERAKQRARRYTPEATADAMLRLYRSLLSRTPDPLGAAA